jgi:hypothetical protein
MGTVAQFPRSEESTPPFIRFGETLQAVTTLSHAIRSGSWEAVNFSLNDVISTLKPLGEAILVREDQQYAEGVLMGLVLARRLDVIHELPDRCADFASTMPGKAGAEVRHYLRACARGNRQR